jgi:16S rRNA (adenine1518-N6/adenine1519-N6)-dimethyltransferase
MFKTKKKFGQHFLIDNEIVYKILDSADLKDNDIVWEIGPGMGALTDRLVERNIDLTIFEIDNDLIPILNKKYAGKCKIVHADILKIDWIDVTAQNEKVKIVTNLPYQISSPFLYKLTENNKIIDKVVVMLQKEVAKRLCASPGKKDYGVLTLKTKFYFDTEYLFDVPPDRFSPPPEVESAVIKLTPRQNMPHISEIDFFWQVVESAFMSRRKTLRNNIKKFLKNEQLCPIDLNRRGETLSEAEFIALYEYLKG